MLLTHAHIDHAAYIHYLRPDIPIYCSEATRLIIQGLQDTGANEDYVFEENFQIRKNDDGDICKKRGKDVKYPRRIETINSLEKFQIDSLEIEPIIVDQFAS